jgi:hypothetical protein
MNFWLTGRRSGYLSVSQEAMMLTDHNGRGDKMLTVRRQIGDQPLHAGQCRRRNRQDVSGLGKAGHAAEWQAKLRSSAKPAIAQ